jgi:hypothetical protein
MRLRWWRIFLAGVLAEILYALFLQFVVGDMMQAFAPVGMAGALVCMLLGGLWVARSAPSRPVLHGALVGGVAIAFYFVLVGLALQFAPEAAAPPNDATPGLASAPALLNHALKLVGGALGGFLGGTVLRRGAPRAA